MRFTISKKTSELQVNRGGAHAAGRSYADVMIVGRAAEDPSIVLSLNGFRACWLRR